MPFRIKKGAPKVAAWGLPEGDSSGFGWVREFESGAASSWSVVVVLRSAAVWSWSGRLPMSPSTAAFMVE